MAEAEPLFREALEGQRTALGEDHPATLSSLNNLAGALRRRGCLAEAERLAEAALEGRRIRLGEGHPDTLGSLNNLAGVLQNQGGCRAPLGAGCALSMATEES